MTIKKRPVGRNRKAVVLLGFGGPSSLEDVPSFLWKLFSDPCVLTYPAFIRLPIAWFLTKFNIKRSQEVYRSIGGKSPYAEGALKQAEAIQEKLGSEYKVFCSMRYGEPSFQNTLDALKAFVPEEIILLPLYPQFSVTTSRSALLYWDKMTKDLTYSRPTIKFCCYPTLDGFISAASDHIIKALPPKNEIQKFRLLFSAHGIPEKFVKKGDPYTWQVKKSFEAIKKKIQERQGWLPESLLCYQSKVGPVPWTRPYLVDEVKKAAAEKKSLIVFPIAFLSEHVETLAELDIEVKEMAEKSGIQHYIRVPTVSCHPLFIKGIANLIRSSARQEKMCQIGLKGCWLCRS